MSVEITPTAGSVQDMRLFVDATTSGRAMIQGAKSLGPVQARFIQWLLRDEMVCLMMQKSRIRMIRYMQNTHQIVCILTIASSTCKLLQVPMPNEQLNQCFIFAQLHC
jgi:hypothetical protein